MSRTIGKSRSILVAVCMLTGFSVFLAPAAKAQCYDVILDCAISGCGGDCPYQTVDYFVCPNQGVWVFPGPCCSCA